MVIHYIGIDPGATGGVVIISSTGEYAALKTPTDDVGLKAFSDSFKSLVAHSGSEYHIYLEDVHSVSNDYVNNAFSFGFYKGLIHALISSLTEYTKVNLVSSQKWQQFFKTTKSNVDKKQHKKDLYNHAVYLHSGIPDVQKANFKKVTKWNADAFLIACYAFYRCNVGSD